METKSKSLVTISLDQLEYYLNRIKRLESQLRSCEYDTCDCGEMYFAPDGFRSSQIDGVYCSSKCAERVRREANENAVSDELDYQFAKSGR